jgi:hypothetical protein
MAQTRNEQYMELHCWAAELIRNDNVEGKTSCYERGAEE